MYTDLCKLKQKLNFVDQKDVIYAVPCKECKVRYVGETGQHFCDRVKQHQNDVKHKKLTNGMMPNKKHSSDWEKTTFLEKERN